MNDFMSKPRFQIPSLRELKQARLLKLLNDNQQFTPETVALIHAEHRRRVLKKKQHRAEAYVFYRNILRDPNATVQEQLTARERLDKLLGLD
ncbi:hypothetical protein Pan241w_46640 [Gimesia alba]|uniref:Uncharacterized protein n=2 Tax=Gimesia alba TaxID=2527973 RepID=A0A517RL49_9PLAN|nr:hypothetical protein Pan241w_46640 [Gimesia alba]